MNRFFTFLIILFSELWTVSNLYSQAGGRYVLGDFHQHTTYTDGSWSIGGVMKKENSFGLSWWANSEHGGASQYYGLVSGKDKRTRVAWSVFNPKLMKSMGDSSKMWRWQTIVDYTFSDIQFQRLMYPDKVIFQGLEWNVPGHEHASTCIIGKQFENDPAQQNALDMAQFEYRFDRNDQDSVSGTAMGWEKPKSRDNAKMLEALNWLSTNHGQTSWVVIAHPERKNEYAIADFRLMNNAAPTVCFGFEGIPGHQKREDRGLFKSDAFGGATYGGCGIMTAQVGGVWDALLSEGRNWWVFTNSDFHDIDGDFWPGEFMKNYTWVADPHDPRAIVNGLRSGNNYVVMGNLISDLDFTIQDKTGKPAVMGQTLTTTGNKLQVHIKVHPGYSQNGVSLLHHIDLIAGTVSGLISPSSPDFTKADAPQTTVIARFGAESGTKDANGLVSTKWNDLGNGWKEITYTIENIKTSGMYFRLRGTNNAPNTPGETDDKGNPLSDLANYPNDEQKAWKDLWFYSNPIFIKPVNK
jgi:hypothetical protein